MQDTIAAIAMHAYLNLTQLEQICEAIGQMR